jgi:hypothetical protein
MSKSEICHAVHASDDIEGEILEGISSVPFGRAVATIRAATIGQSLDEMVSQLANSLRDHCAMSGDDASSVVPNLRQRNQNQR